MLTKCMFCNGVIPAKYDNIYIKHMNDHHRAFVNIKLLFCVSLLDNHEANGFIEDSGINFEAHIDEIVQESANDNEFEFDEANERITVTDNMLKENLFNQMNENEKQKKEFESINVEEIMSNIDKKVDITVVKADEETDACYMGEDVMVEDNKGAEIETNEISNEENIKPDTNAHPIICRKKRKPMPKVNCKCDIKFETKAEEMRHIRIVHKKYFKCGKCKKGVFRREADYLTHISVKHNSSKSKSNICDECGHEALNWGKLQQHMRYFHDNRIFQCEVCSKEITGKANFSSHTRMHERRIGCKECGKTIRPSKMGLHMKTVHVIDELKQYQCSVCGKGFPRKDRYNDHMLIHSDNRAFACRLGCSFASKTAGNRTKHEKTCMQHKQ